MGSLSKKKSLYVVRGNCYKKLQSSKENIFDSLVTDPPYGLNDNFDIKEVLRYWLYDMEYRSTIGGFMGKCYHPDTEILTQRGWVKVGSVLVGDMVCTLNPNGDFIEYSDCVKTYEYDFDGELINIVGRSVEQLVTPNHNVYIKTKNRKDYELVRADEISSNYFSVKNQGYWDGTFEDEIGVLGDRVSTKYFMKFLGLFLGDGYTVIRKNQPEKQDFFGFNVKKGRKVSAIRDSLENLGLNYTENLSEKTGYTSFYVYDKTFLKYLKVLGKDKDKRIPKDLFRYSKDLLLELYGGLVETDGCIQGKKGQHIFSTSSKQLADDFQVLCLHVGKSCVITERGDEEGTGFKIGSISYRCSVVGEGKEHFYLEKVDHKTPSRGNYKKVGYRGKVSCVEVRDNHIIMTRINGKSVWSGNSWDNFVPSPSDWKSIYRVLKPGAYGVVFAGRKTQDLMTISLRLAGFEIKNVIMWIYGSGFPKSQDTAKALDGVLGNQSTGFSFAGDDGRKAELKRDKTLSSACGYKYEPVSDMAKKWDGYGTDIKPAYEPIILIQKPISEGTIADNIRKWGVGAINIDGCRISMSKEDKDILDKKSSKNPTNNYSSNPDKIYGKFRVDAASPAHSLGRFPADIILDDFTGDILDQQSGVSKSSGGKGSTSGLIDNPNIYGKFSGENRWVSAGGFGDEGGASRFFHKANYSEDDCLYLYYPKPSTSEKEKGLEEFDTQRVNDGRNKDIDNAYQRGTTERKNTHPTVKPISLMRYLTRLVTPAGGRVLEPYLGSGTTLVSCGLEGFDGVGFDLYSEYCRIAYHRIKGNLGDSVDISARGFDVNIKEGDSEDTNE